MKNRRGSFTVFVIMAFSAMLIMVFAVLKASGTAAISSTAEHFGRLWGTSILAEYDLKLKERYGLYGFRGETVMVEEKLRRYAEYTFEEKKYIDFCITSCSLDGYSLTEPEILKQQIADAVLTGNRPHRIKETTSEDGYGHRTITSRWILNNLPSAGNKEESDVNSAVENIKKGAGLKSLAGNAAVNQYIFTYFRHYCSDADLTDTYFMNEIEYILCGKADDERARKKAKQKLVIMRNLLNLAYLYGSPEKREIAMSIASVLTPGPEAVLTQGVLMELWAFAEAENDISLLYDGKEVPLLKKDSNWALSLENAMGTSEDSLEEDTNYISPAVVEGESYEDYLRILVNTVPETTRLLRVMDLIQINMKYLYCDYFRLKDYYTGLNFSMTVNGEKHEFKETYERTERQSGELSG